MDTLKLGLEKSSPEAQLLYPEFPASVQPARTCRRSFFKRPWIVFGAVALTWLYMLSSAKRALNSPHHTLVSCHRSLPKSNTEIIYSIKQTRNSTLYTPLQKKANNV